MEAHKHSTDRAEQGERDADRTGVLAFALQIGLFAGLIWGAVKVAGAYFKFTKVPLSFMAKPFFAPSFLNTTAGFWMGWLSFIVFSIAASLLYAVLFRKVRGHWAGIVYGIAWWALIVLLVGPLTGMMKWIYRYDWNTIITDFCLFLIWGLFIGFSISFEFTDEREREPSRPA
ncbi:YqhR family membrane protein [Paenibacillus hodogayensis]|uniref:YqhR family membrane protein n=1 Tax=Paenibacillus hodogayensis TaxID=279208 RepID=A0ABV5W5W5_9BACL